jgi:hypothetical protein
MLTLQVLSGLVKEIDAMSHDRNRRGSNYMDDMVTTMRM